MTYNAYDLSNDCGSIISSKVDNLSCNLCSQGTTSNLYSHPYSNSYGTWSGISANDNWEVQIDKKYIDELVKLIDNNILDRLQSLPKEITIDDVEIPPLRGFIEI